jgi:hypothetical protein
LADDGLTVIVVAAFCRLGGTRGTSKKFPGCNEFPEGCEMLEDVLDVFRLLSGPGPATKETSKGDDGCEARLGDELAWLTPDGDCGLWDALAFESVLWTGFAIEGLPSRDPDGDVKLAKPLGLIGLLWAAIASARSFWMTSLFAFSKTGRFLNEKLPKSSPTTGSLKRLLFRSRTCGGMCSGIRPRFIELTWALTRDRASCGRSG